MYIKCTSCQYKIEFYTSQNCGKKETGYDVNFRMAYTFRTLGHGYSSMKKFTTLMNMPKPMTSKNYNKLMTMIKNTSQIVAEETMEDAAEEIHNGQSGVVDTTVSW